MTNATSRLAVTVPIAARCWSRPGTCECRLRGLTSEDVTSLISHLSDISELVQGARARIILVCVA